jgi:hypothetical protein
MSTSSAFGHAFSLSLDRVAIPLALTHPATLDMAHPRQKDLNPKEVEESRLCILHAAGHEKTETVYFIYTTTISYY